MNDLLKKIEQNQRLILIALACLMFVCFALCPSIDIAGKAQANGLSLIFNGKGMGFSRVIAFLMIAAPVLAVLSEGIGFKLTNNPKEYLSGLCFCASLLLSLILAASFPTAVSFTWGSWIYLILSIAGTAISYLHKFTSR